MLSFLVTRNITVFSIYVQHGEPENGDNLESLLESQNFDKNKETERLENMDRGAQTLETREGSEEMMVYDVGDLGWDDSGDSEDGEYRPQEDEFGEDSDVGLSLSDELVDEGVDGEVQGDVRGGEGEMQGDVIGDHGDVEEGMLSDYGLEDDAMYDTTDEECETGRKRTQKIYYDPKCDHKKMAVVLGMRFENGFQCRDGLRNWAICQGHPIQFRKVTKKKLIAKCVEPCEWKCYGSMNSSEKNFIIRNLPHVHTCPFAIHNKVADYKWLGSQYMDDFRVRPNMSLDDFLEDCNKRFGIQPSKGRLFRAKHHALELLRGTMKHHYGVLRNYVAELMRVDREGRFELMLGHEAVFEGLYIGFSALRKGFMIGCRPIIGLDGCHLKTHLGGQLLCAVGTDANNQMYPIAWGVVSVENEVNWTWFLRILLEELGVRDGNGLTFMSDQQKGLVNAVGNLAPHAEHRNCARHVYNNWKKTHKGSTLMNMFWKAVRCTYQQEWELAMEEMKAEDAEAHDDFMERGPAKICKAFFSTICVSDAVTNNISETFNSTIIRARQKPLIHMLESIRSHLRMRQYLKLEKMNKVKDTLCPRIRKRLEEMKQWARHCTACPGLWGVFEVSNRDDIFTVELRHKTCTCRSWELTGMPCIHALAAIHYMKEDAASYMSPYFTIDAYKKSYSISLPALNGERMWPKAQGYTIQPPIVAPQPGRPKKNRRKARDEADPKNPAKLRKLGVQMTCTKCGLVGHNRRTCKQPQREQPTKEQGKKGRPKKNQTQASGEGASAQTAASSQTAPATSKGKAPATSKAKEPATSNVQSQAESSNPSQATTNLKSQRAVNRDKRKARQGIGLFQSETGNAYYHGSVGPGSVLQDVAATTSAVSRGRKKQPLRRGGHSASQP